MNRQGKIQKMHDKRLKRARAKLKNIGKTAYVSKADRAKLEAENAEVESEPKSSE